ncbi:hypothetical protein PRZ48_003182 [Zasmidium cellare]|uniref:DUF7730 domain-containing protein n=1 Tax=Zasmidium cellare TaxID=395010 RepID=A0ABR0EUC4_ZASCE|nr:hypothetical protein PRZ48_003182 [Zasmidium cellare]
MQIKMGGRVINPSNTTPPRHPASVFKPSSKVTFMDLPAEVRMNIFGYILEEDKPITLQLIKWRSRPREVARKGHDRKRHHRGEVYDRSQRAWVPAPPTYTAIMFLNKQVYSEATQVLYGDNTFHFETTSALEDFLNLLGPRAQYLRFIEIGSYGYIPTTARRAFKLLLKAKGLRKLQFDHHDFCGGRYGKPRLVVDTIAAACKELVISLQDSYEDLNLSASVLDVVRVAKPGVCHDCTVNGRKPTDHSRAVFGLGRCNCPCTDVDKNTEAFCKEIRSIVAGYLGMTEEGEDATNHIKSLSVFLILLEMEPINLVIQNVEDGYQASADGLQINTSTLLGSPVPFVEDSGQYTRTITISKALPYQVKSHTITSGPMQGCQALVLVPTPTFRFLDLHPEIRDIIYDLLLADEPTKLKLWAPKFETSKVVGEEHAPRTTAWRNGRTYERKRGKYIDMERRTPLSLLQVNRQVYREAFEVLYRSRAFQFKTSKTLSRFLELNPDCSQFLTHIILPDWETAIAAMKILPKERPKSLRTIEVSHKDFRKFVTANGTFTEGAPDILEMATPLFDTMYQARRKKRVSAGLEEVLKFDHQRCEGKGGHEGCGKLETELKELIREEYPMD